jgi:hypothetical protein
MLFALIAACVAHAYLLCRRLRTYLRGIAVHPAAAGLERLPDHISRVFRTPMPGSLSLKEREMVEYDWLRRLPAPGGQAPRLDDQQLAAWLTELEQAPPPLVVEGAPPAPAASTERILKENLLALRLAHIVALMCDATRTALFVAATGAVTAVLATGAYPFQPARALGWSSVIVVLTVVSVAVWLIVTFERDQVLSNLARTSAGEITPTWGLAARLAGYVLMPLATLLTSYLPNHARLADLVRIVNKALER